MKSSPWRADHPPATLLRAGKFRELKGPPLDIDTTAEGAKDMALTDSPPWWARWSSSENRVLVELVRGRKKTTIVEVRRF